MIFDSSTSVNFVAIKSKNNCSYVIYTCSIEDLNHYMWFWYLREQIHRLIPHSDAVELVFVFIYIYKQQMLWCV